MRLITCVSFILAGCSSQLPPEHPCSAENPEPYALATTCNARAELECKGLTQEQCAPWRECMAAFEERCRE